MSDAVLGLVLAGGQSRRMGGGDKGFMQLNGRPLLQHVIDSAKPQVADLVLNSSQDPNVYKDFELAVVADRLEGFAGPLAGVHAGLDYAKKNGFAWMVTWACDAPFTPDDLVAQFLQTQKAHQAEIVVASSKGRTHPVSALWATHLLPSLTAFLSDGGRKVDLWTAQHKTLECSFGDEKGKDPFFNINRPEDLAKAGTV